MQTVLIADLSIDAVPHALPSIEQELSRLAPVVLERSTDVEGATLLAAEAGAIVVVGDDRSLNAAVNALMSLPATARPSLGVVPVGECGLAQTFGMSSDPMRAAKQIARRGYYDLDVGLASCAGEHGDEVSRYFANIAEIGFGAHMISRAGALPHVLGRAGRFLAFWTTLYGSQVRDLQVSVGRKSYRGSAYNVVIGNGQYSGEGLRVSPRSYPGDGILDLSIMKGPRSDAFRMLPKMYLGEHVPHPSVVEMRGPEMLVEAEKKLAVHVDGVVIGATPARFSIEPNALRLMI